MAPTAAGGGTGPTTAPCAGAATCATSSNSDGAGAWGDDVRPPGRGRPGPCPDKAKARRFSDVGRGVQPLRQEWQRNPHPAQGRGPNLIVDGEPVIELDYSRLHPTLLFHRAGVQLDFDPYSIAGLNAPGLRELGKSTFQRLINRKSERTGMGVSMRAAPGDPERLPTGVTFKGYLDLFKERLEPIAPWFATGVGMELQREDSDLAITVLDHMDKLGALVLPVHDSFIVQARHGDKLREVMRAVFKEKYGFYPLIRQG